jgi:peptide/nickel transport system substrate-binding protein/oligopeptide transport system substrate-binding protein
MCRNVKFPFFVVSLLAAVLFWFPLSCKTGPDRTDTETPPVSEAGEREAPPAAPPEIPAPEPEGGEGYAEPAPRPAAQDELAVVFSRGEVELDFRKSYLASEAQIYTALYEGLFSYHPRTLEPVPAAAAAWVVSQDKKQWTFIIRKSARYQNGDSLKAEDFRAAWLSLLEPGQDSPYSSLFDIIEGAREYRLGTLSDPAKVGISAKDDKTLVVRLVSPAAYFPSMLCHHSFSPIHPSMLDEDAWKGKRPLSNGPFYIEEFDEDHILLVKNKNYWDEKQNSLNKISLVFRDGEEASELWNSGEAHWISGDVDLEVLTNRNGITVNPMFATHYYFIRSAEKPWDDYRVRRALSLVLPWEEMRQGYYLPAKTLIFPIPGYPEIEGLEEINIEEAQALLSEAGFPKGVGLPELVIRITPSPEAERLGQLMAAAWFEKLGVPVRIDVVPYSRYFQSLKQDDYEVGSTPWIGDFADPYTFLQMWRRDSNLNDAGHDDADYEDLMEKSMTEEGEKRWTILAEAEKLLLDRGSVLPIFFSPAVNVVDTGKLDGWYPNVLDIHPFKYMAFQAARPLPGVAVLGNGAGG